MSVRSFHENDVINRFYRYVLSHHNKNIADLTLENVTKLHKKWKRRISGGMPPQPNVVNNTLQLGNMKTNSISYNDSAKDLRNVYNNIGLLQNQIESIQVTIERSKLKITNRIALLRNHGIQLKDIKNDTIVKNERTIMDDCANVLITKTTDMVRLVKMKQLLESRLGI